MIVQSSTLTDSLSPASNHVISSLCADPLSHALTGPFRNAFAALNTKDPLIYALTASFTIGPLSAFFSSLNNSLTNSCSHALAYLLSNSVSNSCSHAIANSLRSEFLTFAKLVLNTRVSTSDTTSRYGGPSSGSEERVVAVSATEDR